MHHSMTAAERASAEREPSVAILMREREIPVPRSRNVCIVCEIARPLKGLGGLCFACDEIVSTTDWGGAR